MVILTFNPLITIVTEEEPIQAAAKELEVVLKGNDFSANRQLLVEKINDLIEKDFQKLVGILYRVDVSEDKLKTFLKENPATDAGLIIADLVIERQLQKIKSRRQSDKDRINQRDNDIDENEKW